MRVVPILVLCLLSGAAAAEDSSLYDRLWPELPASSQLTLSQQITDQLTELGNLVGGHMNALSNDVLSVRFDGRRRRAKLRFGTTGSDRLLVFKFDGDVHFTQGLARVQAKLDVGVAGRVLELELPELEMAPASYRGERGVEIRMPLLKHVF